MNVFREEMVNALLGIVHLQCSILENKKYLKSTEDIDTVILLLEKIYILLHKYLGSDNE